MTPDLTELVFVTLKRRKEEKRHGRPVSRLDAINIAARTRAKAGHMNNRTRLITALKHEILEWEQA